MKKILVTLTEDVTAFEFSINLLRNNRLLDICNEFNISDVYIDLFEVCDLKSDFSKKLTEMNKNMIFSLVDNKSGGWAIRTKIHDIYMIEKILLEFDVREVNIWDAYTDWNTYLEAKKIFNIKKYKEYLKDHNEESKFYLNYNIRECNTVSIYCEPNYNVEKVLRKIKTYYEEDKKRYNIKYYRRKNKGFI